MRDGDIADVGEGFEDMHLSSGDEGMRRGGKGIDEGTVIVLGIEEAKKVEVVGTRGLHADKELITIGAERASRAIFHSDKGSETQSTDEDLGRQVTDYFKGSRTLGKISSPASFFCRTKYIDLIFN